MWLLLVAAGSGYLARCWHRTLTTRPRLASFPYVDPEAIADEQADTKTSSEPVLEESSPVSNASVQSVSTASGHEVAPKPAKRTFSPKVISRKLFSSEANKSKKATKGSGEVKGRSLIAENGAFSVASSEKALGSASRGSARKSPWSSFKSKRIPSSQGDFSAKLEEDLGDSCADHLKSSNDSSSLRKAGSKDLSSSLSFQDHLEHELHLGDSTSAAPGQSAGEFVEAEVAETSENLRSHNLQDATKSLHLSKRDNESRQKVDGLPESAFSSSVQNSGIACGKDEAGRREADLLSVAETVAQIEKGNLSAKLGSGTAASHRSGPGKLHAGFMKRGGQTSGGDGSEQIVVHEADNGNGWAKGKRRADEASKAKILGSKVALSAAAFTGKRSIDIKEQNANESGYSAGVTLTSITGKRMKDGDKTKETIGESKKLTPSIVGGILDLSQVFFGLDTTLLDSTAEERSPTKFYKKSRYGVKIAPRGNMRRMRESPRPVSALESCLRAQFPEREEGSRVGRALNFSLFPPEPVSRRESLEPKNGEACLDGESASVKDAELGSGYDAKERGDAIGEGALGLPSLRAIPVKGSGLRGTSESPGCRVPEPKYPRPVVFEERIRVVSKFKLDDVLWRSTTLPVAPKKRKVSQACSTAAIAHADLRVKGYELEALVIPPMEGLLFSFGVGIGVMSLIGEPEKGVERLKAELQKSEEDRKHLEELLKLSRENNSEAASAQLSKQVMAVGSLAVGSLAVEKATGEVSVNELAVHRLGISDSVDEEGIDLFDLVRRDAPETPQQSEHLADLEAELEAELDALTGGIPDGCVGTLDFAELDPEGMAGVANRDLGVDGLPALLDWDDDNDDFITEDHVQGGGVPPRELRRLLRKLQFSRAELRIAELEADLEESEEKVTTAETELQRLRDAMKSMTPRSPSGSVPNDRRGLTEIASPDMGKTFDSPSSSLQDRKGGEAPIDGEKLWRRDRHAVGSRDAIVPSVLQGSEIASDGSAACISPKWESAGGLRSALSRRLGSSPLNSKALDSSLQRSTSVELGSTLRKSPSIDLGSIPLKSHAGRFSDSTRPPPSDLALLRATTSGRDRSDNDAVCDEFLSSVLGSSEDEDNRSLGSSVSSHPGNPQLPKTFSLDDIGAGGDEGRSAVVDSEFVQSLRAKSTEEDLDQVVNKLLKRDSSSVKNAISAFLQWEAETDEDQEKEDSPASVEERGPVYLRRTAGKATTPQKPISSSSSPLRTAVLTSRFEERARTTSSGSKNVNLDLFDFSLKGRNGHEKTKKLGDEDLEVFQPPEPQPEDRSMKTPGRREYQLTRNERSPRTREGRMALTESRRELFKKESPVFGSVDVDLESLMDLRREKRYSSSKMELSSSRPAGELDVIPSGYRPREDASRAGTNSPKERQSPSSVKLFFQSPKTRNARPPVEKRLYRNLTSDWIADLGSKKTGKK